MRGDKTYLVTLNCGSNEIPADAIQAQFYGARDWLRWAPGTYFIRSNLPAQEWLNRIRPLLSKGDDVFIAALDMNDRVGWMKPIPKDWLTRNEFSIATGV